MDFAQWEAQRVANNPKLAAQDADPNDQGTGHGLLPSGLSSLGALLGGLVGPVGSAAGAGIGSAVNELKTSIPALWKMGMGPMAVPTEGKGIVKSMVEPAGRIAADIGENVALNHAPSAVASGLMKGGNLLSKAGAAGSKIPLLNRALVYPLLHMAGLGEGGAVAAELASTVGPKVASAVGPKMVSAGEALPNTVLSGLKNTVGRMFPAAEEAAGPSEGYLASKAAHAARLAGTAVPKETPAAPAFEPFAEPPQIESLAGGRLDVPANQPKPSLSALSDEIGGNVPNKSAYAPQAKPFSPSHGPLMEEPPIVEQYAPNISGATEQPWTPSVGKFTDVDPWASEPQMDYPHTSGDSLTNLQRMIRMKQP